MPDDIQPPLSNPAANALKSGISRTSQGVHLRAGSMSEDGKDRHREAEHHSEGTAVLKRSQPIQSCRSDTSVGHEAWWLHGPRPTGRRISLKDKKTVRTKAGIRLAHAAQKSRSFPEDKDAGYVFYGRDAVAIEP
jgi:hypothetical protein